LKEIVICCGGEIGEYCLSILSKADYIIGADRGAKYVVNNGFTLHQAIGDFDSCRNEEIENIRNHALEINVVNAVDKNDTDSGLALKNAIALKPNRIIMLGGTGTRLDHMLNNIQLLSYALDSGISLEIVDANNRIQLIGPGSKVEILKSHFSYVSFIPLTERVEGICLVGFVYPLKDATFVQGSAIGISNQIAGESASVSIEKGRLLCIESKD
jgi:thiamine pyrophosphokinase